MKYILLILIFQPILFSSNFIDRSFIDMNNSSVVKENNNITIVKNSFNKAMFAQMVDKSYSSDQPLLIAALQ